MTMIQPANETIEAGAFSIVRWSANSGSERQSRANLVLSGGGREWRAHATGNGAVDAVMRAVDEALSPVLGAGVELLTYEVHATGHGHAAAAEVELTVRDREAGATEVPGTATHRNVLAASLAAYIDAINRLLAEKGVDVAAIAPLGGDSGGGNGEAAAEARRRTANRIMNLYND